MRILMAAMSENGVIGRQGQLPWHLPADLLHFKQTTQGYPMVMGRRTFASLPGLLPGREHVVLTHQRQWVHPNVTVIHEWAQWAEQHTHWCAIGGAAIYALALPMVDRLYLTKVHAHINGDVYFPAWDAAKWSGTCLGEHAPDEHHAYAMTFWCYQPKDKQ